MTVKQKRSVRCKPSGKRLTPKEARSAVLAVYPLAIVLARPPTNYLTGKPLEPGYQIITTVHLLGSGKTIDAAWQDAAKRLESKPEENP